MAIIIPVLICLAVAVVCAIILTVSNILFGVKEDEKFLAIRDALPSVRNLSPILTIHAHL